MKINDEGDNLRMKTIKLKKCTMLALIVCMLALTSCSNKETNVGETMVPSETSTVKPQLEETNPSQTDEGKKINTKSVDFSKEFNGINGCAVIYNPTEGEYLIYNKSMSEVEVSPYSTFKIISTLMGLNNGVIADETSKMKYNGKTYPMDMWNKNLTLKEAFETSCVWYFRQVIDGVGQKKVKAELEKLNYGNCDISEWSGNNINSIEDLNGFWLNSSLKISPMEQVQVLYKIFEGKSQYSQENISILRNVMLVDKSDNYNIYGKTGTGKDGEGWYTGFAEKNGENLYFAVYLEDSRNKEKAIGSTARKITISILERE